MERAQIESIVIGISEKLRVHKQVPINLSAQVVKDLGIEHDVDDYVALIQYETDIKPPKKEWEKIRTVGEVIELLVKYAG